MLRTLSLVALALTIAAAAPAAAQAPSAAPPAATAPSAPEGKPTAIRGTVETLTDHTLTVKARDGNPVTVKLAPNFTVRGVVAKNLADIKPGDKVGITSVKNSGGARQAIEIHILPANIPSLRLSEYPWDLRPDSIMTNAIVAQVDSAPQGRMIKVTFDGKEAEISVPSEAAIVGYGPGDVSMLKPGTTVFVFARKQPDGGLTAAGVTAEKNGVKPPM